MVSSPAAQVPRVETGWRRRSGAPELPERADRRASRDGVRAAESVPAELES